MYSFASSISRLDYFSPSDKMRAGSSNICSSSFIQKSNRFEVGTIGERSDAFLLFSPLFLSFETLFLFPYSHHLFYRVSAFSTDIYIYSTISIYRAISRVAISINSICILLLRDQGKYSPFSPTYWIYRLPEYFGYPCALKFRGTGFSRMLHYR